MRELLHMIRHTQHIKQKTQTLSTILKMGSSSILYLKPKSCKAANLGSGFLKTACPYPGTTRPDFKTFQSCSLICSSEAVSPTSLTMPRMKERTSWLARPWRGPARPDRAAEKERKGSERAEPTRSNHIISKLLGI